MFCIAEAGLSLGKDLQIHFIGGKVMFVVVSATRASFSVQGM